MFKCDKRCQDLYGLTNSDLVSHADSMKQIHIEDRSVVDAAIKNALVSGPGGGKYDAEFRTVSKDGKDVRWIRSKGQAYFNERKKPYRFSGTVMDITVQKQLQQQKDNFLGIASHELKTPVTSIKAYAQVLESIFRNRGDIKEAGMLSKLNAQVNRLTSLIADLLDVTKIQSGRLEFNENFFDFGQLVREVIDDMRPTAPKHQIEEEVAAIDQVYGDRERIRQVIINLITNAIKYSPHSDKIIVKAYIHKKHATLCVRDFGVGIAIDKQGKVFEQFYRVSGDKQHTFPGLGLGLYISSEIVKRMEGRIWVESEEGKGATFCFSLSLDRGKTTKK
jgi:PAS domain S-box-containing protein